MSDIDDKLTKILNETRCKVTLAILLDYEYKEISFSAIKEMLVEMSILDKNDETEEAIQTHKETYYKITIDCENVAELFKKIVAVNVFSISLKQTEIKYISNAHKIFDAIIKNRKEMPALMANYKTVLAMLHYEIAMMNCTSNTNKTTRMKSIMQSI